MAAVTDSPCLRVVKGGRPACSRGLREQTWVRGLVYRFRLQADPEAGSAGFACFLSLRWFLTRPTPEKTATSV